MNVVACVAHGLPRSKKSSCTSKPNDVKFNVSRTLFLLPTQRRILNGHSGSRENSCLRKSGGDGTRTRDLLVANHFSRTAVRPCDYAGRRSPKRANLTALVLCQL